jgi:hypothetical protein
MQLTGSRFRPDFVYESDIMSDLLPWRMVESASGQQRIQVSIQKSDPVMKVVGVVVVVAGFSFPRTLHARGFTL